MKKIEGVFVKKVTMFVLVLVLMILGYAYNNTNAIYPAYASEEATANCITFSSDNSFTLTIPYKTFDGTIEFSSNGTNWETYTAGNTLTAVENESVFFLYLRGSNNTKITDGAAWDLTGSNINCDGNIENLLDYQSVIDEIHPTVGINCFNSMFYNCSALISAPELASTTLNNNCYHRMFTNCTSLISAPALPALTLASNCYYSMFSECTSLINAPALPATTLASNCYQLMFYKCTSLINAPALSAATLADSCYSSMFSECTSLINAPDLSAMTLANSCYYRMFNGCSSLISVPDLPALTLSSRCYQSMFSQCSSLINAPEISATTLADFCYFLMFSQCSSLINAPALPVNTLTPKCYYSMFSDCTSLINAPELSAMTLANSCYNSMFSGCSSLETLPELPAITLANECYAYMFSNCISISLYTEDKGNGSWKIPNIESTAENWNVNMFYNTGGNFCGGPIPNTFYYYSQIIATVTFDHNEDGIVSIENKDIKEFTSFLAAWKSIIKLPSTSTNYAKLTLKSDWIANSNSQSFGNNEGFGTKNTSTSGPINVGDDDYICIDLNGYNIDRGVPYFMSEGFVIAVNGFLTICDSSTSDINNQGSIKGGQNFYNGGGINVESGSLTIEGGQICNNKALEGGGIYVSSGSLIVSGGIIKDNLASLGGAIFSKGSFKMTNGNISANYAETMAGAVYVEQNTFVMENGTIQTNTAQQYGGVYINDNSIFILKGGNIINNNSIDAEPAVFVKGTLKLSGQANVINNYHHASLNNITNIYENGVKANVSIATPIIIDDGDTILGEEEDTFSGSIGVTSYTIPTSAGFNVTTNWGNSVGTLTADQEYYNAKQTTYLDKTEYLFFGKSYTITYYDFDSNSTKPYSGEPMALTSYTYGSNITLPTGNKIGYNFLTWVYFSANSYLSITKINQNMYIDLVLYANWDPLDYSITYDSAIVGIANVITNSNVQSYTIETQTFTLVDPVRYGYTFDGWFEDEYYENIADSTIEKGSVGNIIFFAKWSLITNIFISKNNMAYLVNNTLYGNDYDTLDEIIAPLNDIKITFCGETPDSVLEISEQIIINNKTLTLSGKIMLSNNVDIGISIYNSDINIVDLEVVNNSSYTQHYSTAILFTNSTVTINSINLTSTPNNFYRSGIQVNGGSITMYGGNISTSSFPFWAIQGANVELESIQNITISSYICSKGTLTATKRDKDLNINSLKIEGTYSSATLNGVTIKDTLEGSLNAQITANNIYGLSNMFVSGDSTNISISDSTIINNKHSSPVYTEFLIRKSGGALTLKNDIQFITINETSNKFMTSHIADSTFENIICSLNSVRCDSDGTANDSGLYSKATVNFTEEGTTIANANYEKKYPFVINYVENSGSEVTTNLSYTYGTGLSSLPTSLKIGYTLEGWTKSNNNYDEINNPYVTNISTTEKVALTLYAKWSANTNTAYTVKHYFEALDGTFALDATKTENLTGTTDTNASANYLTGNNLTTGFEADTDNANNIESGNIAGNGSLVLHLYYTRTLHTITWKDGNNDTLETDSNIKYGETPTYNGTTPTKAPNGNYIYISNNAWSPAISAVVGNTVYTATFVQKSIKIETQNNLEEDCVKSEISIPNGTEATSLLVKTIKTDTINNQITAPENQEIIKSYNAKLFKQNTEISNYTGTMTIKIAIPVEVANRNNLQVVLIDKETNTAVIKNTTVQGNYLVFETNSLGDIAIVADKQNSALLWIFIGLGVVALILLLWIFGLKRKVVFVLNNEKVGVAMYKRGETLNFPQNLAKYKWFTDKEQTQLFTKQNMGWLGFTLYRNNENDTKKKTTEKSKQDTEKNDTTKENE